MLLLGDMKSTWLINNTVFAAAGRSFTEMCVALRGTAIYNQSFFGLGLGFCKK